MQHYKNGVEAEEKSDKSPVTQADRDAEDIIERALAALVPEIQMIGEEACSEHVPDKLAPHFFSLTRSTARATSLPNARISLSISA